MAGQERWLGLLAEAAAVLKRKGAIGSFAAAETEHSACSRCACAGELALVVASGNAELLFSVCVQELSVRVLGSIRDSFASISIVPAAFCVHVVAVRI